MKTIQITNRQKILLINILRDVKQDIEINNTKVLEKNKHQRNYLAMLNENAKVKISINHLLENLE